MRSFGTCGRIIIASRRKMKWIFAKPIPHVNLFVGGGGWYTIIFTLAITIFCVKISLLKKEQWFYV